MKYDWNFLRQSFPWLALVLGVDSFAAVLLWLADAAAFRALAALIVLATVFLFAAVCGILGWQSRRRIQAFRDFLNDPDTGHEETLTKMSGAAQEEIHGLGELLRENRYKYEQAQTRLEEYEEYVEAWAHEIKTPIALLTMLLDNHREEIPEDVCFRLDYVRSRMQELTEQMMFCARLKSAQKDYLFEYVSVRACVGEVIEDYRPLLEEKQFQVILRVPDREIYTDRRSLRFMLSQVVSNAVKYSGEEPELVIELFRGRGGEPDFLISSGEKGAFTCVCPEDPAEMLIEPGEAEIPKAGRRMDGSKRSEFSDGLAGEKNQEILERAEQIGILHILAGLSKDVEKDVLLIRDNGRGVKSCDLPYIFNRGFTGFSGEEGKNATGMGLYLVRELAGELGITLAASSAWKEGFELRMGFPVVLEEK